jgi:hypothetical protein
MKRPRQRPWSSEEDYLTWVTAQGWKIRPVHRSFAKLCPKLTLEDWQELNHWMTLEILMHDDPDPEFRRQLLAEFEQCPCCQQWLGHNRPPADDVVDSPMPRRQKTFDFDR